MEFKRKDLQLEHKDNRNKTTIAEGGKFHVLLLHERQSLLLT